MTLPLSPDELLTTTRSVRKRLDLDRPVPPELIRECLEIALQAPTGGNPQGWHWLVVTDPELRGAIGEYYRRSFAAYRESPGSPAGSAGRNGRQVQARVASSADWLAERMGQVPVLVSAASRRRPSCRPRTRPGCGARCCRRPGATSSPPAPAGWARAWTTLHLSYEREIAELLGIPPEVRQGVLLPTAYYTGETFRPAPREPLDQVLHLDRW